MRRVAGVFPPRVLLASWVAFAAVVVFSGVAGLYVAELVSPAPSMRRENAEGDCLGFVLIAVLAIAAWWFLDFDMPEIVIPAATPGVGAGILYFYGGPLAWATVALLAVIAAYCIYGFFSIRQREDKAPK